MIKCVFHLLILLNFFGGSLSSSLRISIKQEREFVCPGLETGFYPEDENICSATYYTCVNGVAYPQQCPGITVFDPVSSTCVDFEVSSCYVPSFTCPSAEGFFPVPATCGSDYFICVGGNPSSATCPFEAIFDPVTFACVPPEQASCNQPFTCPSSDGLFPYPGACSAMYYNCTGSQSAVQYCPGGYYFDPEVLSCVLIEEASCAPGGVTTTSTTTFSSMTSSTPTTLIPTTPEPFVCPGDGYYSTGVSCTGNFYNCTGGQFYVESCPGDMVFVPEYSSCVLFLYTTCAPDGWNTTTASPTPTVSSATFTCPIPNGNFQVHGNRLAFWNCRNGIPELQNCSNGKVFRPSIGTCV
ncbi:chitin-binding domain protein cbd-1-like isoform X1 [Daphnia pulex]|uniref:chitin-binding domain protein cbd-1-like isoform X1 n=1 Tax=Daphnia pulex TaxID=6669 RepID=UPI001EE02FB9|nr:chitin-binding domain protein cbd-1-like isoform X1 [Daphnia pulex]